MNEMKDIPVYSRKAIESYFPTEQISLIAEKESWRKEVYRPTYYLQKWWARRLGSVFRAIVLESCVSEKENIISLFYKPASFSDKIIYDPMMGSGVTIGEARKLGCRVIGRDINPVAYLLVKSFINDYSIDQVKSTFEAIKKDVSGKIKTFYTTSTPNGERADVLYYFWVKVIICPFCNKETDLFKNRIFSTHAYPNKKPAAKSLCPNCDAINNVLVTDKTAKCAECGITYELKINQNNRNETTCKHCGKIFSIIKAVAQQDYPPNHRMYAKMVLTSNGKKEYQRITLHDIALYKKAAEHLKNSKLQIPRIAIQKGHNTNQILNYNYRNWNQLFNDRQLYCLGLLSDRIHNIEDKKLRELFACLFSGCLEFNNMFASFKGEGTGAVRHMFYHHILKPERAPLEANVWGTSKSSGSFSTLFETRIMRAMRYKNDPYELRIDTKSCKTRKVFNINSKISGNLATTFSQFKQKSNFDIYLSCGNSASTDIEDESVDAVVTDPPFFANVHYSELADFFYVWQKKILTDDIFDKDTTRSFEEIQDMDENKFADKLSAVFTECNRVLKKDGVLVFTFHHSQIAGWKAIMKSIRHAGFFIPTTHFVKSEMSVAVPKSQAKNPITIDIILVCRKLDKSMLQSEIYSNLLEQCIVEAKNSFGRLKCLKKLSQNDAKNILLSIIVRRLTLIEDLNTSSSFMEVHSSEIENAAIHIQKGYQKD
ncbi:MAG: DUF1156 domain-containing protein [Candidatus Bathyarchaeota archaeon]|nr:DUF1156 domain-containing protein [Candidatus Bathyarchaeota archaeon]